MSFISKIEEKILKNSKYDYMDSLDMITKRLEGETECNPPKGIFKSSNINGCEVFAFGDREKSDRTLIYVHGGAFIHEINYQHLIYCYLLAHRLNAYVLAPVYPLTPANSCKKTFKIVENLYRHFSDDNIVLMGDSAGGGFVLSFCQYLNSIGLRQPDNIIVFSPWVDISMSGEYDSKNDPILGDVGLREIGKVWAGDLDTKDYRVSPLFGDNSNLARTLIFAGENEIFYSDIKKYCEKLEKNGVDFRLIVGEGLFHIYPMFPMPEAWHAFKEIKNEIM